MADTAPPSMADALHSLGDAHHAIAAGHQAAAGAAHDAADALSDADTPADLLDGESELSGDDADGNDAGRTMPAGSAQQRAFRFPAGSGAARSLKAATSGRRG